MGMIDDFFFNQRVNQEMDKAIREGQFDNLPGKGEPINWGEWDNPFIAPEDQMRNLILKNAGFAPGWVQERRDILTEREGARASLNRSWEWVLRHGGLSQPLTRQQWEKATKVFQNAMADLNTRIRSHNLSLPSSNIALPLIDIEREIFAVRTGEKLD
jgi:hypothetical protein